MAFVESWSSAMPEAAGFSFVQSGAEASASAPLVLLHGSGGGETFLQPFAQGLAPERVAFGLRGQVAWEGGYAFFRRNPDRSLDRHDLDARCSELCRLLGHLIAEGHRRPYLVGYSNGAIMAAAAAIRAPELSSGAVLIRPLSPCPDEELPPMKGYPVLLLGGAVDARRRPGDTPALAEQFRRAGAAVSAHVLPAGHGLEEGGLDLRLAKAWLDGRDAA